MFVSKKKLDEMAVHVLGEARTYANSRDDKLEAKFANIDTSKPIIGDQAALERLIKYMEDHRVDEVTVDGITVKKTIHLMPEPTEAEKKKAQQDLVDYAAD